MILNDLLLELRAIRLGIEYQLQLQTGDKRDLLKDVKQSDQMRETLAQLTRKPRDHTAIIHKNDESLRARETLAEMGDDTLAMIDYVRTEIGEEAAEGMKQFYEKEIVGKR